MEKNNQSNGTTRRMIINFLTRLPAIFLSGLPDDLFISSTWLLRATRVWKIVHVPTFSRTFQEIYNRTVCPAYDFGYMSIEVKDPEWRDNHVRENAGHLPTLFTYGDRDGVESLINKSAGRVWHLVTPSAGGLWCYWEREVSISSSWRVCNERRSILAVTKLLAIELTI